MSDKRTIQDIYNLEYDESGQNSGLTNWYNQLLGKTIDEIDEIDVSKMIRQDILKKLAIEKAMEIFIRDPLAGEMNDGDILENLCGLKKDEIVNCKNFHEFNIKIKSLNDAYENLDWVDEEHKSKYKNNLEKISSYVSI